MKKYTIYQMNIQKMSYFSILLVFVLWVCFIYGFKLESSLHFLIPCLCGWLVLHEILHAIGFIIATKGKMKNIKLGSALEKGILYTLCQEAIPKWGILISLLFPLVWIGIVTLVIGLCLNSYLLVVLSIVNIAGASGDIMMTLALFKLPSKIEYIDLGDNTSFALLSNESLPKHLWGIDVVREDKIENMQVTYKKSIEISKLSWIVFWIIVLETILECVFVK